MALDALVDSFLPQSEKNGGIERVNVSQNVVHWYATFWLRGLMTEYNTVQHTCTVSTCRSARQTSFRNSSIVRLPLTWFEKSLLIFPKLDSAPDDWAYVARIVWVCANAICKMWRAIWLELGLGSRSGSRFGLSLGLGLGLGLGSGL